MPKKRGKKLDAKTIQEDVNKIGISVVSKLHAVKLGFAVGIVCAIFFALITLAGIYGYFSECSKFLVDIYGFLGYSVSQLGILLGAVYGFIDGFIFGFLVAWIYNKLI